MGLLWFSWNDDQLPIVTWRGLSPLLPAFATRWQRVVLAGLLVEDDSPHHSAAETVGRMGA